MWLRSKISRGWGIERYAAVGDFLRSLETVSPDVIKWVESLPDPSHYVNLIQKNPTISLNELKQYQPPIKEDTKPYHDEEIWETDRFVGPGLKPFKTWALVQLRKHRIPRLPKDYSQTGEVVLGHGGNVKDVKQWYAVNMGNYFSYMDIFAIGSELTTLCDWFLAIDRGDHGDHGEHFDIASYSLEQAMEAENAWIRENQTENTEYDEKQNVLYSPPEWNGWHVVQIMSANDTEVEGNLMKHCVGQCVEAEPETPGFDVFDFINKGGKRGELHQGIFYDGFQHKFVRLYSLRDAEGKPHVTLEVDTGIDAGLQTTTGYERQWKGHRNQITQMYGNANSKPKPEYAAMMKSFIENNFRGDELVVPVDLNQAPSIDLLNKDTNDWLQAIQNFAYGIDKDTGARKFIGEETNGSIDNLYIEVAGSLYRKSSDRSIYDAIQKATIDRLASLLVKIALDLDRAHGHDDEKILKSIHWFGAEQTELSNLLSSSNNKYRVDNYGWRPTGDKSQSVLELDRHIQAYIKQFTESHEQKTTSAWSYVFPRKFSQAKPMPLPFAYPNDPGGGGGLGRIDRNLSPEGAAKVRELYPGVRFFAAGTNGVCADLGNGNVGKLTDDKHEADRAKRLIERPAKSAVKVYNVIDLGESLNNSSEPYDRIYLIEMEFVYPLYVPGGREQRMEPWEASDLMRLMTEEGLPTYDVWHANVGRNDNGELVLLDLGSSNRNIKESGWSYNFPQKFGAFNSANAFFLMNGKFVFFRELHQTYLEKHFGMNQFEANILRFSLPRGRAVINEYEGETIIELSHGLQSYYRDLVEQWGLEFIDRPRFIPDSHYDVDIERVKEGLRIEMSTSYGLSSGATSFLEEYNPQLLQELGLQEKVASKIIKAQLDGEWFIDDSGYASFADGDSGDYNHEMVATESMIGDPELYERFTEGTLTDDDRENLEVQEPGFLAYMESGGDPREWVIEKHNWIRVKGSNFELWTMDREALDRIADFVGEQLSQWGDEEEDADVYISELSTGRDVTYTLSEIEAILKQDQTKEETMQLRQQQANDPNAVQLDPRQPGFQMWEPTLWDHQGEDKMMPMAGGSWSYKFGQSKAMPLPVSEEQIQEYVGDGYIPSGIRQIDRIMTQETADLEMARLNDINMLGAGAEGVAITHIVDGRKIASKYAQQPDEAELAKYAMTINIPCLPKVYDVIDLQRRLGAKKSLWRIDMELCSPCDISIYHFYNHEEVEQLERCLRVHGIRCQDIKPQNVGRNSEGSLVLLDFGLTKINYQEARMNLEALQPVNASKKWNMKFADGLWEDIEEKGPPKDGRNPTYDSIDKMREYFDRQDKFRTEYGWSVPTRRAIEHIQKFVGNDMILEVGAGKGLWAKLMQDLGMHVTPTDLSHTDNKYIKGDPHTEVQMMDAVDAVNKFGDHSVLMLNWPPYNDPMAAQALKAFRGNKLIYVGEGWGGCTGDDCFHNIIEKEWQLVEEREIDIPQWYGIHDWLHLYRRKSVSEPIASLSREKWKYTFGRAEFDPLGASYVAFRAIDLGRVEQVLQSGFPSDQYFTTDPDRAVFYANFNSEAYPGAIFECKMDTSRGVEDINDSTDEQHNESYEEVRSAAYEIQSSLKAENINIGFNDIAHFIGQQVSEGIYDGNFPASLWLFIAESAGITPFDAKNLVPTGYYGNLYLDERGVFGIGDDVSSGQLVYSTPVPVRDIVAVYLHSSVVERMGWSYQKSLSDYVSLIPGQMEDIKNAVDEQLSGLGEEYEDTELYDYLVRLSREIEEKSYHGEYSDTLSLSGDIYRKLLRGDSITDIDLDTSGGFVRFEMPRNRIRILYVVRKLLGGKTKRMARGERANLFSREKNTVLQKTNFSKQKSAETKKWSVDFGSYRPSATETYPNRTSQLDQSQDNDYLYPDSGHDYDINWDHEPNEQVSPELQRLIADIVKEIQEKLVPKLKVFKTFKVEPVVDLNPGTLAEYISGTYSAPVIAIDLGNIDIACEEYNSQCGVAIETTIVHELGHALQEAKGKPFDEDEAEEFAYQWHYFREIHPI